MPVIDPAAALGTARGTNRINSSGAAPNRLGGSSQIINNIVPAGGTLPIPCAGTMFYLLVATLTVQVRPSGGTFSNYSQGNGLQLLPENAFNLIEVQNTNAVPVVFSLFVGFDGFIDNTLIINNASGEKAIVYPTFPVANASNTCPILDKSGSEIQDINGAAWYAIKRNAIYVNNADAAAVYSLENTALNKTAILFQPLQTLALPFAGNFKIEEAGALNIIVSESYQAIPKVVS